MLGRVRAEGVAEAQASEYFRRQCFLAAFPEDDMMTEALDAAPESIVLCTDWPHAIAEVHSGSGLAGVGERNGLPLAPSSPSLPQTLAIRATSSTSAWRTAPVHSG